MIHAHPVLTQFNDPIPVVQQDNSEMVSDFCLYLLRHAIGDQVDMGIDLNSHVKFERQEAGFFPLRLLTGLLAFTLFSWLTLIGWIVLQLSDSHTARLVIAWGHDLDKANLMDQRNSLICEALDTDQNLIIPYLNGTHPSPYETFPQQLLQGVHRLHQGHRDEALVESDLRFIAKQANLNFIKAMLRNGNGYSEAKLLGCISNAEDQDPKASAVIQTLLNRFGDDASNFFFLKTLMGALEAARARYGEARFTTLLINFPETHAAFRTHKAKILLDLGRAKGFQPLIDLFTKIN
jgi:hypothetical protein